MKAICSGISGCGKTWGGLRMEHCTACCETFSGPSLGDAHLTGPKGGDVMTKRCLTPDEMTVKGWRLVGDVWRGPAMTDEQLAKRFDTAASEDARREGTR